MINSLPSQISNQMFKDANWNLSGFATFDDYLLYLISTSKTYFDQLPIKSVHGCSSLIWNGGRVINSNLDYCFLENLVNQYNSFGCGVFATFSNQLLSSSDLLDESCNHFLDLLASNCDLNGVIVSSDLLSKYIRMKYPNLKQTCSVVRVSIDGGLGDVEYYKSIIDEFDKVVIHPDDSRNFELLSKLEPSRYEILVNENCNINCKRRPTHYTILAQQSLYQNNIFKRCKIDEFDESTCKFDSQLQHHVRNCNLTITELKTVYDLGFRDFKLQGRKDALPTFMFDCCRYIFEQDYIAPLLFKYYFHK